MEAAIIVQGPITRAPKAGIGTRGGVAVAVTALLMTGGALAAPATKKAPEVEAYEAASADLEELDAELGKRLQAWLTSDNPYRRQTALSRYATLPGLLPPTAVDRLLSLLDDEEQRPVGSCVYLVYRDRTNELPGEGEYEQLAHCQRTQRSNAELASELLPRLANVPKAREDLCTKILASVGRQPRHGDRLLPTARAACSYLALLNAAPQAQSPAATQALLRMFLAFGVSPEGKELAGILPLLGSPERRTRGLAGLVVLLAGTRQGTQVPTQDAVKVLTEAVADDTADDVLRDLPLIREAGAPLGAALIRRLARPQAVNPVATLQAVAVLRKLPPEGGRQLARMLEGDFPDEVLRVIAALEPGDARKLRSQVLGAAQGMNRRQKELGLPATDLSLALRALRAAESPLSPQEFRALDRVYQRACLNKPMSYHDDPNAEWCSEAEKSLIEFALEGGFRFSHPSVY